MAKEVLLYHHIDSWSSEGFIKEMNELEDSEPVTLRVNTGGGSPEYGFGIVAKFSEYGGVKKVKVDGKAYSFGTFLLCYTEDSEALDVSEFLIHRAAYSEWFERSEFFNEEIKGNLERINTSLKKALEAKIDVKKFEEMKNVKMKDIFSMDSRIDVFLNAKEAKAIGLIDKIVKITPTKRAKIDTKMLEIAAHYSVTPLPKPNKEVIETSEEEENFDNPKTDNKMKLEEFKSKHSELHTEVVAEAVKVERSRVGAWMTFNDVDPKAVAAGIESGENLDSKEMAEFSRKVMTSQLLEGAAEENEEKIETTEEKKEASKKEKASVDFLADVKTKLN